jgi:hypothetical protein
MYISSPSGPHCTVLGYLYSSRAEVALLDAPRRAALELLAAAVRRAVRKHLGDLLAAVWVLPVRVEALRAGHAGRARCVAALLRVLERAGEAAAARGLVDEPARGGRALGVGAPALRVG